MALTCQYCNKYAKLRCSKCKIVFYCNMNCQKQDWTNHKKKCRNPLANAPEFRCLEIEELNIPILITGWLRLNEAKDLTRLKYLKEIIIFFYYNSSFHCWDLSTIRDGRDRNNLQWVNRLNNWIHRVEISVNSVRRIIQIETTEFNTFNEPELSFKVQQNIPKNVTSEYYFEMYGTKNTTIILGVIDVEQFTFTCSMDNWYQSIQTGYALNLARGKFETFIRFAVIVGNHKQYCKRVKDSAIIRINRKNQTVRYIIDGKDYGIAFCLDRKKEYAVAVCMIGQEKQLIQLKSSRTIENDLIELTQHEKECVYKNLPSWQKNELLH